MKRNKVGTVLVFAALLTIAPVVRIAFAQGKAGVMRMPNRQQLQQSQVKQLMLSMDTGNGRITKQQWLSFTEAQFDQLDENKSGEIDLKHLAQADLQAENHNAGK